MDALFNLFCRYNTIYNQTCEITINITYIWHVQEFVCLYPINVKAVNHKILLLLHQYLQVYQDTLVCLDVQGYTSMSRCTRIHQYLQMYKDTPVSLDVQGYTSISMCTRVHQYLQMYKGILVSLGVQGCNIISRCTKVHQYLQVYQDILVFLGVLG